VPGHQLSDSKTEGSLDPCSVGPLARHRSRKTKSSPLSVKQPSQVMTANGPVTLGLQLCYDVDM